MFAGAGRYGRASMAYPMTVSPSDAEIAAVMRKLVSERTPKTICPSEVARALADDWRPLMPEVRRVAALIPEITATQKGVQVDPVAARGPIRLALRLPPLTP